MSVEINCIITFLGSNDTFSQMLKIRRLSIATSSSQKIVLFAAIFSAFAKIRKILQRYQNFAANGKSCGFSENFAAHGKLWALVICLCLCVYIRMSVCLSV